MSLQKLVIENIRNIASAELILNPGLNILLGDNASGKTSVLEAITLLASARSFRCPRLSDVQRYEQDKFRVIAQLGVERTITLGLERSDEGLLLKAQGRRLQRVSELAVFLPVQVIHPDSHTLISGGPKQRRQFLDWGVFHVEQSFSEAWRRYDKALKQRNAALKSAQNRGSESVWDPELTQHGHAIHELRLQYLNELNRLLPDFSHSIAENPEISIDYQPGWDTNLALNAVLARSIEQDRQRGFTHYGPHRAELVFRIAGHKAQHHVSRGQQKMLVMALQLTQTALFSQKTGRQCILLLDDLAAELDAQHRDNLWQLLENMNVQALITAITPDVIPESYRDNAKLFLIQQGNVEEMLQ